MYVRISVDSRPHRGELQASYARAGNELCDFKNRRRLVADVKNTFRVVQVVNAENQFTFEMHMFPSADFADTYTSDDYPVQVTPSDQLHFGLSVDSPLNNLELFALHCLATPSDDPEASPSVNIIQEGCHIDTTLQLNNALSSDMALYYSIQSFTFPNVEPPSLVYIHCTMVVCFKDDPDSRCSDGCISARRRRRAVSDMSDARVRRASETDETVTISQGPFKVVGGEKQASTLPTVGIAVGTAAGIAGVLLMVVAVFLVRKRRGRDVKGQAEDRVGFDNYSFELWGKGKAANVTPKPDVANITADMSKLLEIKHHSSVADMSNLLEIKHHSSVSDMSNLLEIKHHSPVADMSSLLEIKHHSSVADMSNLLEIKHYSSVANMSNLLEIKHHSPVADMSNLLEIKHHSSVADMSNLLEIKHHSSVATCPTC
ncbi:hypothetical protein Bbelb_143730 [Branchiostoma belcheri]|nr:hypothetical protein Bbelb_143730 [Branchiostoma belcheri]